MSFAKNLFQQLKWYLTQGLKSSYSLCKQELSLLNISIKRSIPDLSVILSATSPTNSNWFEFVGLVARTKVGPCD